MSSEARIYRFLLASEPARNLRPADLAYDRDVTNDHEQRPRHVENGI